MLVQDQSHLAELASVGAIQLNGMHIQVNLVGVFLEICSSVRIEQILSYMGMKPPTNHPGAKYTRIHWLRHCNPSNNFWTL